jgi:predicted kinase
MITMTDVGVIVHLLGPAGVGKLTIARGLAPVLRARVVDNQWINNPIFGLLDNDRVSPFPSEVWTEIDKVRSAVLETIARISSPGLSYILTNELYDDDPQDRPIAVMVMDVARRRSSPYIPVRLECAGAELAKRIVADERAKLLKSMNPEAAQRNAIRPVLLTGSPNELTLDSSQLTPKVVVDKIADHVARVRGKL